MAFISAHRCDIGRVRAHNDDYVWVDEAQGLFILADGMGGYEAGDVASRMAAHTVGPSIARQLAAAAQPLAVAALEQLMVEAIEVANQAVHQAAREANQKRRMGTTVVVLLIYDARAYISHAGDSRAYLARGSDLIQLTEDDSWGAQFAAAGVKTNRKGERSRFDHFLTKSVGQDSQLDPSFSEIELQPDDWLLLCSDGLWNMIDDGQILRHLQQAGNDPEQAADSLVSAANAAGGKDNISVIAIKFHA